MRSRQGEIAKEGDHSAEGHCGPDRDRIVAGFRCVVARTGRSTRARCGNSRARTGLTALGLFLDCHHFDFLDSASGPIGVSF